MQEHSSAPPTPRLFRHPDGITAVDTEYVHPGRAAAHIVQQGGHAAFVDVGTNVLPDGSLVGDVDEAGVTGTAAALTPVPGGVGSVTTALLLLHTVEAARRQVSSLPLPAGAPKAQA